MTKIGSSSIPTGIGLPLVAAGTTYMAAAAQHSAFELATKQTFLPHRFPEFNAAYKMGYERKGLTGCPKGSPGYAKDVFYAKQEARLTRMGEARHSMTLINEKLAENPSSFNASQQKEVAAQMRGARYMRGMSVAAGSISAFFHVAQLREAMKGDKTVASVAYGTALAGDVVLVASQAASGRTMMIGTLIGGSLSAIASVAGGMAS